MLYILPPLRSQNPPPPWNSLMCSNGTNNNNNNSNNTANGSLDNSSSWKTSTSSKPHKIRLRNLQIIPKRNEETTEFHDHLDTNRNSKSLSECYFAGKGTALVLPDADAIGAQKRHQQSDDTSENVNSQSGETDASGFSYGNSSAIQLHLQSMFYLLRPEETLKMAVKLESVHPSRTRYLVVVSRGCSRGEESCLLGIDCNEETTVGLVLRVLADTKITLDGDGGFSVSVCDKHHIFKPVSVQAMWSALQTLHKVSAKAREGNYYQGGGTHSWVEHYERRVTSDQSCLNEWHVMDCLESRRPPSPDSVRARPTERGETEKVIRSKLKEIMMSVDLDEVTSKFIRTKLEEELDMDLGEFKSFIDQEMLVILGQMDAPTEIFDHVYLGSEWNASNYEELQRNGVGHILNVTREIDNFFPGTFDYLNVRVYDDEQTDLLKHWDDTFKYITKAKNEGSKVLVHCKMGISRSASVVIAYAMKAYNWDFNKALLHVKEKRSCIKPNTNFLTQLETYQGILDAMKNKEKLQRSKSETNLKSPIIFKKIQKMSMGGVTTVVVHQQEISKFNGLQSTLSGQDLRQLGGRPKSWSPDNLTTREIKEGVKSSPGFMSLEDLSQKSVSNESVQETKSSLARHVLMPCDNGESYSVSPNQIVHLPGHEVVIPATRNDEQTVCGSETNPSSSINNSVKTALTSETWDPGEGNLQSDRTTTTTTTTATSAVCDPQSINSVRGDGSVVTYTPVWTSSAVILTQSAVSSSSFSKVPESQANNVAPQSDPFSNQFDRVFDKEEMKNNQPQQQPQRRATIQIVPENLEEEVKNQRDCPSRQSSWSSYDSAVVLGFHEKNELSRHSSWGSGDTKLLPSRNSSWGSYDMRPKTSIYYMEDGEKTTDNQNGIYSYDKEDIPWHPGTVKRTKQRLEGATRQLSNDSVNSNSCTSLNKSSSSDTLHINFVEAINETLVDSAISDKIDIPRTEKRLPLSPRLARLSASAPESCSIELVTKEGTSLSRSASNVTEPLTEQRILVKLQKSFLENTQKNKLSKKLEDSSFDNSLGKVQNLKKEFEAKSSITCLDQMNIPDQSDTVAKPSSKNRVASLPSSPISNHQAKESATQKSEDLSFKTIRSVFEKNEEENHPVKRRHRFPNAVKNNSRYSYIEGLERSPKVMATPFIYTLKPDKMETEFKRPPIGPTEIRSTIIASATKKKQQQFGKTHPVSMLSRQHNTVYNTM